MLLRCAGLNLANTVCFCGRSWVFGRGSLEIACGTWLSPGAVFYTHKDAKVIIGSKCDIGPDVTFVVGSHLIGNSQRRAGAGTAKSIIIGDGTWIGARVTVLEGVTIGNGCVIAAGSVVHQDIEDNCLAAGIPAKIKRRLSEN
jgi:maltose O-acetyltransferase